MMASYFLAGSDIMVAFMFRADLSNHENSDIRDIWTA